MKVLNILYQQQHLRQQKQQQQQQQQQKQKEKFYQCIMQVLLKNKK